LLREGLYLEAIIETAKSAGPLGPTPDLRRMLVPVGPVAVFSASNFPFAFSVPGGDTASALAAGCPVVVKAHPAHPLLSVRVAQVINDALRTAGAPDGVFALVHGVETGVQLLKDQHIAAGAFTGSIPGGRALFDVANARPVPIPFYAEMGSLNPVFVTRAAVQARGEAIARAFVGSFTLGVGQFCTKPASSAPRCSRPELPTDSVISSRNWTIAPASGRSSPVRRPTADGHPRCSSPTPGRCGGIPKRCWRSVSGLPR
jgi:NADP-dependent aldehyde dehydrogenase